MNKIFNFSNISKAIAIIATINCLVTGIEGLRQNVAVSINTKYAHPSIEYLYRTHDGFHGGHIPIYWIDLE